MPARMTVGGQGTGNSLRYRPAHETLIFIRVTCAPRLCAHLEYKNKTAFRNQNIEQQQALKLLHLKFYIDYFTFPEVYFRVLITFHMASATSWFPFSFK
ncbi:cytochrome b561 [Niabella hirudinis]